MFLSSESYLSALSMIFEKNYDCSMDKRIRKRLLFDRNLKGYKVDLFGDVFNSKQILDTIQVLSFVIKKKYRNISLLLNFLCSFIADKLVYVILEDLCYCFVNSCGCRLFVQFPNLKSSILADGIQFSALNKLPDKASFNKVYRKDLYKRHYRNIFSKIETDGTELSILNQEVRCFLINNGLSQYYSDKLSEVISEIVGNACEHGKSDCLLDVDVTDEYTREDDGKGNYYGVNVAVVNYSEYLFHTPLMTKMEKCPKLNGRYTSVYDAKINHSKFWKKGGYDEEFFFIISSFQHKISGSQKKPIDVGGTGLTTLIQSLEDYSYGSECYLLSGKMCLKFLSQYLQYDQNRFIGFNRNNDYINDKPDDSIIGNCKVFFPGSAFNLHFIVEK